MLILVPSNVIFLTGYLLFGYENLDRVGRNETLNRWNQIVAYFLYLLFVLLLVCVIRLIQLLKQMRDFLFSSQMEQRDFFNREIRTLWIILVAFNITYLIRGLWDQLTSQYLRNYTLMVFNIILGLIFDCFPVTLLLYFHYRNFKVKSTINSNNG